MGTSDSAWGFWLMASIIAVLMLVLAMRWLQGRVRQYERTAREELNAQLSQPLSPILQQPRSVLIQRLMDDPHVQNAILEHASDNNVDKREVKALAREYVSELMPGFFALFYFRVGYWLARRYLRSMYDLTLVQHEGDAYRDIPKDASVVLVGNHRSNIDVMVLAYICSRASLVSFAAGEWARPFPLRQVVHMCGSYIIRRDAEGLLYKQILQRYVHMMINAHMPQGIFLEGGLTRDGAIQPVKLGLLRYILATLGKDEVSEIVFVPVAFNYDRVPEDRSLLRYQKAGFRGRSGSYTVLSTLRHALLSIRRLLGLGGEHFGQAAVSLGEPIYMRRWLAEQGISLDKLCDDERKEIVGPVAGTLMEHIKGLLPVLPVSVVATVFTEARGKPLAEKEVELLGLQVVGRFRRRSAQLLVPAGDERAAIQHGVQVLLDRGVIVSGAHGYHVAEGGEKLLAYYHCSVLHHLDGDADVTEALREGPLQSVVTLTEHAAVSG